MANLIVNTKSGKCRVMGTKKEAKEFARLVHGKLEIKQHKNTKKERR